MSVEERFAPHVTTRRAVLLCEPCGDTYRPHVFNRIDAVLKSDGAIEHVNVMFRCECGAIRQWGNMGPRPGEELS